MHLASRKAAACKRLTICLWAAINTGSTILIEMVHLDASLGPNTRARLKLVALVFACVIIPILVISAALISNIRQASLAEFEYRTEAEIAHVERLFTQFLHGLRDDAVFLANSTEVSKLGAEVTTYFSDKPRVANPKEVSETEARVFDMFRAFGSHREALAYVYLGMDHGGYIQWPPPNMSNYDPRTRPWYQSAINQTQPVISPPYIDLNTGKPVVDYVVRFEGANGAQGVVGVDVFLSQLTDLVHSIRFGESGYLLLLDDNNNVLADPSNPANGFINIRALAGQYPDIQTLASGFSAYQMREQNWFIQKLVSPDLGWTFIGLVPQQYVFERTNRLIEIVVILVTVLTVLFSILGYRVVFQNQSAKNANPLTGLPGNLSIDDTVDNWLAHNINFRVAYFDLDNFKPFNDHYGYSDGDRAIIDLAEIIKSFADKDGNFIGHIGGDDFVVLFKSDNWYSICESIIEKFDQTVPKYYATEDLAKGGITNFDRQGGKQFFSLLGLSIGVTHPDSTIVKSHYEVSALAASAKSEAKKSRKSSIFISRRRAISQLSEAEMNNAKKHAHIKLVSGGKSQ